MMQNRSDSNDSRENGTGETKQEVKDDDNARLISVVLQRHAEQRQQQLLQRPELRESESSSASGGELQQGGPAMTVALDQTNAREARSISATSPLDTARGATNATMESLLRRQMQFQRLPTEQSSSSSHSSHILHSAPTLESLVQGINTGTRLQGLANPFGSAQEQALLLLLQRNAFGAGQLRQNYENIATFDPLTTLLLLNNAQQRGPAFLDSRSLLQHSLLQQQDQASRLAPGALSGPPFYQATSHSTSTSSRSQGSVRAQEDYQTTGRAERSSSAYVASSSPTRRKRDGSDGTLESSVVAANGAAPTKRKKRSYHHESFPVKLHRLLRETEEAGKRHIISFSADGKEFSVHKPVALETEILPKYFRHNQLSSFRRLLNMYGFVRLQDGAEGGTFRHPRFLKSKPELCKDLDRVR